jgi:hypothetical protein
MKILVKKNNKFVNLGEGKIYSKRQLRLNEDGFVATAPNVKDVRQFVTKGSKMMNQNPNVKSVQNQLGQMDHQNDASTGEGLKISLPANATGAQISKVQNMASKPENDDMSIDLTPSTSNTSSDSSSMTNESRIIEMRRNSIPFTKKELHKFLREI